MSDTEEVVLLGLRKRSQRQRKHQSRETIEIKSQIIIAVLQAVTALAEIVTVVIR